MAYKDSDEIATNSNYALGDYSFRIERSSVPGSINDKIEAICTQGGKNARKSIQVDSRTQLRGWYVEADESVATVYASVNTPKTPSAGYYIEGIPAPNRQTQEFEIPVGGSVVAGNVTMDTKDGGVYGWQAHITNGKLDYGHYKTRSAFPFIIKFSIPLGHQDKDTCYAVWKFTDGSKYSGYIQFAWTDQGGETEYETKEVMVGRFAIDLEDAGGAGPGSDWIDPGDYDPDWEEGDPTHTLYVTVTGALSGRHNDPIEDPSYSYIPADKNTVKDYGCGGDGGYGGGGGAGASTVVVHKFATNQANSKEVTAIARRHGYGSGGGKGGKGGDGCILVYY